MAVARALLLSWSSWTDSNNAGILQPAVSGFVERYTSPPPSPSSVHWGNDGKGAGQEHNESLASATQFGLGTS